MPGKQGLSGGGENWSSLATMIIPEGGQPYVVMPKGPNDYDSASPVIQKLLDQNARFVAVAGIGLLAPCDTGQLNDGGPSAARTAIAYNRASDQFYVFQGGSYTPDQIQDLFRGLGADNAVLLDGGGSSAIVLRRDTGGMWSGAGFAEGQLRYPAGALRFARTRAARLAGLRLTRGWNDLTRRTVLRLGAGLAGACALDPLWQLGHRDCERCPSGRPAVSVVGENGVDVCHRFVRLGGARGRRDQMGDRASTGPLRPAVAPVIALHGRDMDGRRRDGAWASRRAWPSWRQAGYPPFAVAAVDGGNGWWHRRATGEDSGAMVLNEFLPMLASKGLDTSRVSFLGWSMGGYGALLLGGALGAARTAGNLRGRARVVHRLRLGAPRGCIRRASGLVRVLGVRHTLRCRRSRCASTAVPNDRFYDATKQFVASLRRPPSGVSFVGGHDVAAWKEKLPRELAWLARA